ncbi:MAG: acetate--CoA ligase family protein [Deltaproteobacteria bacterium]|nr:acetate--CoA ligase family protein [Deltaproteobacteria bacterium]MBW2595866.1 acetate--CoA ligase family protein [Deltaproteobacteria bacterium]
MNIEELLDKIRTSGNKALTESESKQLLKAYGVPVISETVAFSEDEAVEAARKTGFPVVLKGLGATLLHKTERGLVHLNLADVEAVKNAAFLIAQEAGDELEGLLVQPQVQGKREFVAGLFRDEQFGPVIMFGIGGVFTEALSDVVFRVAPLTESDAAEMLDEIKAKSLLGEFRGEKAADRDKLIKTLMGLSRTGMEIPEISEIDINPLVVTSGGDVVAVDALIVPGKIQAEKKYHPPVAPTVIRELFYPKSIAFVGASGAIGKWGHLLVVNTISGGYKGEIYLVNPKGGTIAGRHVYKSVSEIPGDVDLGVVTIPAKMVLDLIPQFKEKGIKNMLLITSGFGESDSAGKALEEKLAMEARKAGIVILGPNTMGICNPHREFFCIGTSVNPMAGSTAIVSQSGNLGVQLLAFAEEQAIGIRGFCGSGNEAMVTVEDFIDGLEIDPLTKIIILYIESVKDGRRFFEGARRTGKKKPIVLLKGGQSGAGNRAASSHTGALSSDSRVFDAVCKQAGIVKVERSMELLDLAAAFSSLPLPKGNRVAIVTLGGGWGVITADMCIREGLEVPDLPDDMLERMDKILPAYWSRSNPADIVGESDNTIPLTVMEEFLKWDGCDAVINLGILGMKIFGKRLGESVRRADPSYSDEFLSEGGKLLDSLEEDYIARVAHMMEKYKKPILGVSLLEDEKHHTVYNVENCAFKSVFYANPERAVKALSKMYEYFRFLNR